VLVVYCSIFAEIEFDKLREAYEKAMKQVADYWLPQRQSHSNNRVFFVANFWNWRIGNSNSNHFISANLAKNLIVLSAEILESQYRSFALRPPSEHVDGTCVPAVMTEAKKIFPKHQTVESRNSE
jgi:hypothetical protein